MTGAEIDGAVLRHPAGRRRSIGFHRVELLPAQTLPVHDPGPVAITAGMVRVPAVYALECHGCGTLFRVGSPHLLDHHQAHRRRRPAARLRAALSLAERAARRLIEEGASRARVR